MYSEKYGPGVTIYPVFRRLPMGLSHSVLLMQLLHEECLVRRRSLRDFQVLRGDRPAPVLGGTTM